MLHNLEFHISYVSDGEVRKKTFLESFENKDLKIIVEKKREDNLTSLKMDIYPKKNIEFKKIYGDLIFDFQDKDKIYANGYQSWTDSREFSIKEKMKGISKLALPVAKKFNLKSYGDYNFQKYSRKKGDFHSYTYSYIRRENTYHLFASLTEESGFTVIETSSSNKRVRISKDSSGLNIKDQYTPFQLIYTAGSEEKVFNKYFQTAGIEKPQGEKITGWTSWYNYYENITEEKILKNLDNFGKENKKIDYWALGHIHQNEIINDKNPVITYPGIPQGRDFGEKEKKGFYLVELTQNNDPKLDFIYSSKYIWKEVDITIDEKNQIKTIDEILDHILLKIKELFNQDDFNYIVRWNLDIYSRHISKIKQKNEEIEDYIVNELNRKNNKQNFVWSEDCNLNFYRRITDKSELAKKDKLFFDIIDFKEKITNDEDLLLELKEKLGDIWQGQSDLENIDEYRFDYNKEIEEILENAENEILKKLWEERGE